MSILTPAIESSLQALCRAIVDEPTVRAARDRAEAFLADEAAVSLYRDMMNLGRSLESRHRGGELITEEEAGTFGDLRDKAEAHEGIRAFSEAQDLLQDIANTVNTYVSKTLEKGRVPSAEELAPGGCGAGCGCHH